jgi:hypothetical protein
LLKRSPVKQSAREAECRATPSDPDDAADPAEAPDFGEGFGSQRFIGQRK